VEVSVSVVNASLGVTSFMQLLNIDMKHTEAMHKTCLNFICKIDDETEDAIRAGDKVIATQQAML